MACPDRAESTAPQSGELQAIERLVEAREAWAAIERATAFQPRDRREEVEVERLLSRAHYIVGDDRAAIHHLARALRKTSGLPALRVHTRSNLAELFHRVGKMDRAERQLRRALAEVHAHGAARSQQPWLLNSLALIHRRRGMVGFAIRTYEEALEAAREPGNEVRGWGAIVSNLALTHLQWGNVEKAGRLLDELERAEESVLSRGHRVGYRLTRALHRLETGDLTECERELDQARDLVSGDDVRASFLERGVRAELQIAQGLAARAVRDLEEMLPLAESPTLGDLFSATARRLASALLDLGAPKQALEKARMAVQRGRENDIQEWAAGLRVMGQCQAALGRMEEAMATFGEALSVLDASECHAERARLYDAMRELGLSSDQADTPASPAIPRHVAPSKAPAPAPEIRLPLADGRAFLTCDGELAEAIRRASGDRLPVLIVGETGTGKELVARLIHEMGEFADRPWVVVDCTTLPENLVEAELFGASKGAFTGAVADRPGLVAAAEGGTLFLDELPELSPSVQAKLLRLLQEGTYRRVGEERVRTVHTRVLAAAHRDPGALMAAGALRSDLFYRLNGHRITIPPLRERPADLVLLARERARETRLAGIRDEAFDLLRAHPWPGNVRELEMLIRVTSAQVPRGSWLDASAFQHLARRGAAVAPPGAGLKAQRRESEREYLRQLLDRHGGNVAAAAREISMSRQGLHKALRRVGLL